jgi:hypothetical protein
MWLTRPPITVTVVVNGSLLEALALAAHRVALCAVRDGGPALASRSMTVNFAPVGGV